jgi:diguanylate cyclase (GGDEF)-like protein/PAS domain S-box-containing protein
VTTTFDPVLLADFGTEMVSLHDGDGRFLTSSAASRDVLGYAPADLVGRHLSDLVHPEDARALETAFEGVPGEPRLGAVTALCRLRHADGHWTWLEVTVRPALGMYDGALVVSLRGAAELVAARQAAEWAEETLRQVFDHAPSAMAMVGLDNRFERVNLAFCSLLDTTPDQLIGRSLGGFTGAADPAADRFAVGELAAGRVEQITGLQSFPRAGRAPVHATTRRSIARSANGRQHIVLHVLGVRDQLPLVPEQTRTQPARTQPAQATHTRVEREARHVPEGVTGLTSRPLLLDRLTVAAARPERETHYLVMFFVDVEGTAKILDRHGRRALETVLTTAGNRLRATCRSEDTVARFGDRGFVVLTPTVAASSDVVTIRRRLARAIGEGAIVADGRKFKVSASVGASFVGPREVYDPASLLERADAAMGTDGL